MVNVTLNTAQPGDYWFVVFASDRDLNNKGHYQKTSPERGPLYHLASDVQTAITSPKVTANAEAQVPEGVTPPLYEATLHVVDGSSVTIEGTSTADPCDITSLDIGFGDYGSDSQPTLTQFATTAGPWSYTWSSPQSKRVWLKTTTQFGEIQKICADIDVETLDSGDVVYVGGYSGDDGDDGLTWSSAKKTVQVGIDRADELGAEVWVADATYEENVTLRDGVAVYGGFHGLPSCETCREQRNPAKYESLIYGDGSGSTVTADGVGPNTCLDGFTLRNGLGTIVGCSASSPRISGNRIDGNRTDSDHPMTDGVVCQGEGAAPLILGNVIVRNFGTGVICESGSAIIRGNRIQASLGSGISVGDGSPTIEGNYIVGNYGAAAGGGINNCSDDPVLIADNVISGNSSSWHYGGGISCEGTGHWQIVNNTIIGNQADSGGGVYCNGTGEVSNNIITHNSSGIMAPFSNQLHNNCITLNGTDSGTDNYVDDSGSPLAPGEGDLAAHTDPGLAAWRYNYIHLQPGSPCIDEGDDDYAQTGCPPDIDGQARIQDGQVDIGADEFDGTIPDRTPDRIFVDSAVGQNSDGSGEDWSNAKMSVMAALDSRTLGWSTQWRGGDVCVKNGTYSASATGENTLLVPHFWYLLGGYTGDDLARDTGHTTVLDGTHSGEAQENHTIMAFESGYQCSGVDQFTLQHGYAAYYTPGGGAVFIDCAAPIITNNVFDTNSAYGDGGAIRARDSRGLIIDHNWFTGNTSGALGYGAGRGGAISVDTSWQTRIVGNDFSGNSASAGDGGAVATSGGDATISDNEFAGNTADFPGAKGGALLVVYDDIRHQVGQTVIDHNTFRDNSVKAGDPPTNQSGGAVCVRPSNSTEIEIAANTFEFNSAPDYGGALSLEVSYDAWHPARSATIINNLFVGNSAGGIGGGRSARWIARQSEFPRRSRTRSLSTTRLSATKPRTPLPRPRGTAAESCSGQTAPMSRGCRSTTYSTTTRPRTTASNRAAGTALSAISPHSMSPPRQTSDSATHSLSTTTPISITTTCPTVRPWGRAMSTKTRCSLATGTWFCPARGYGRLSTKGTIWGILPTIPSRSRIWTDSRE